MLSCAPICRCSSHSTCIINVNCSCWTKFWLLRLDYRLTYLITIALVISIATATITLTQWVQSGSGNANFYFGSCTTYMLALIGLAYETVNAHLINQDVQWSGLKDPNTHRFYVNVPAERLQKAQWSLKKLSAKHFNTEKVTATKSIYLLFHRVIWIGLNISSSISVLMRNKVLL